MATLGSGHTVLPRPQEGNKNGAGSGARHAWRQGAQQAQIIPPSSSALRRVQLGELSRCVWEKKWGADDSPKHFMGKALNLSQFQCLPL